LEAGEKRWGRRGRVNQCVGVEWRWSVWMERGCSGGGVWMERVWMERGCSGGEVVVE
jgi:hypothetical protein